MASTGRGRSGHHGRRFAPSRDQKYERSHPSAMYQQDDHYHHHEEQQAPHDYDGGYHDPHSRDYAIEEVRPHAASYMVPEVVETFIRYFHRHVRQKNLPEIQTMYDIHFNKHSERYYKTQPWPNDEYVAGKVGDDPLFIILYKELYYRHIYARLQPDVDQRVQSYFNYCDLFNTILSDEEPVDLVLPNQWLWDIIDEFIYQYQSYTQFRCKLGKKTEDEREQLKSAPPVWNVHSVLNVLHSLVEKSNILQQLDAEASGQDPERVAGEFGNESLYRSLGYFSLIGLLRLHCHLGDYHQALKVMDKVDISKKSLSATVPTCRVTTFYYIGFAYLMMRRHPDAIRTFCSILVYLQRTKMLMQGKQNYQYDQVVKQTEQMYSLLALSLTFCPQTIDESVNTVLQDKFGERMHRLAAGDEKTFTDLFSFACPKFLSPNLPSLDAPPSSDAYMESYFIQLNIFMSEVHQQGLIPVIRSYLKLYTSMPIAKMAAFLEMNEAEFRTHLLRYKHKMCTPVWKSGSPLSGEMMSSAGTDFYIDGDMIHIADTNVVRPYGEYFVRQINKVQAINHQLQKETDHSRPYRSS